MKVSSTSAKIFPDLFVALLSRYLAVSGRRPNRYNIFRPWMTLTIQPAF